MNRKEIKNESFFDIFEMLICSTRIFFAYFTKTKQLNNQLFHQSKNLYIQYSIKIQFAQKKKLHLSNGISILYCSLSKQQKQIFEQSHKRSTQYEAYEQNPSISTHAYVKSAASIRHHNFPPKAPTHVFQNQVYLETIHVS